MTLVCRVLVLAALAAVLVPDAARAQGFVGASVGSSLGAPLDDCAACDSGRPSVGFNVGVMAGVFGTELEVTHTPSFFGPDSGLTDQTVTTVMQSVMLKRAAGVLQPFAIGGLGVMHAAAVVDGSSEPGFRESSLVWNLGGGLLVFPVQHVGLRAELKYFRPVKAFDIPGLSLSDTTLQFSRASLGFFVRF